MSASTVGTDLFQYLTIMVNHVDKVFRSFIEGDSIWYKSNA